MTDVHDSATRSRNMSAIRAKNTKPELALRTALHRRGFRYRLHVKGIAGTPDLVFRKYHAVVFVHGCFFHVHKCPMFKWPRTRTNFWRTKLTGNAVRDRRTEQELKDSGWRVGVVWECRIRGPRRRSIDAIAREVATWLRSGRRRIEI